MERGIELVNVGLLALHVAVILRFTFYHFA